MLEVKGIDELLDTLNKLHQAPKKASSRALKSAGELVRKTEVKVVEKHHSEYSQNVGKKALKKYPIKTVQGRVVIDIGLRGSLTKSQKKKDQANISAGKSRPTYWDQVKGLWYNNWGFYHNKTGRYVAGSNWIAEAYTESEDDAYKKIRAEIIKEMGL